MKLLIIGLDCAPPSLVFERYRESMSTISKLMEGGTWGPLRSTRPPITVPAWACMTSGRDPGEWGLYGFRNRVRNSYELSIADRPPQHKRIWDYLGDAGYSVASLFVPLTSPPSPLNGVMASCFLTPDPKTAWTFPSNLGEELSARFGDYLNDIDAPRAGDLDRIYREILAMTDQHFDIAEYIAKSRDPNFMMLVEMGPDRLHHAFWQYIDPTHPQHDTTSAWTDVGERYYAHLDQRIAKLLDHIDDDTTVMIVSDHGAKNMLGGVCINDWLIESGWLTLKQPLLEPTPLKPEMVDWSQTRAWAAGGYYARVFLNLVDREPQGLVPLTELKHTKAELIQTLQKIPGRDRDLVKVEIDEPHQRYRRVRGFPPDLLVYFEDLDLRALGSVGNSNIIADQNDTGFDSCNHDWEGIFILSGTKLQTQGNVDGAEIYDVAKTALGVMGVEAPSDLLGRDWSKS